MTDILTESIRVVILVTIVVGLVIMGRRRKVLAQSGWHLILGGFFLLLFGCIVDLTDNFESLNRFVVIGDTEVQAVLEKLVGFLGGFILLAIGLIRWLPHLTSISELQQAQQQLEGLNTQLLQANDAKSAFLANMSHEIRTPMTAILGFADILENDCDVASDPEQVKQALYTIRQNGEYLLAIINDILDISKIEAGKLDTERIPMSPGRLVWELMSLMEPRAAQKEIELKVDQESMVPEQIESDPIRLRQILMNLLSNAVKFTEAGSVNIRVAVNASANSICFEVIDTGIGMTPQQLDAIRKFEPFNQADNTTTRKFGGTGLGLHISRRLADLLGGWITVDSTLGQGTTFSLTIPMGNVAENKMCRIGTEDRRVNAKPLDQEQDARCGNQKALRGLRILVAEDGLDNQRLIGHILKHAGAHTVIVNNGLEAIDQIMKCDPPESFDMVLMDMQMPKMDGYQATRRLRESGIRIPIIALTAHAMSSERDKCRQMGCNDYMTKPINRKLFVNMCLKWGTQQIRNDRSLHCDDSRSIEVKK